MGEAGHHLGLVDEHVDELLVLREVRQDPLDRHDLLEALDAFALGLEHLRHAADRHAVDQLVGAEAVVAPRRLARGRRPWRLGGRRLGGLLVDGALGDGRQVHARSDGDLRIGDQQLGAGAVRRRRQPRFLVVVDGRGGAEDHRPGLAAEPVERVLDDGVGAGGDGCVGRHREGSRRDRVAHLDADRARPRGEAALVGGQRRVDELGEEVVGGQEPVAFPRRGSARPGGR